MSSKNLIKDRNSYQKQCSYLYANSNTIFGFWIYLMSDCIIFATLFATYGVMVNNSAGGPSGKDIFEIPFVFLETIILLLSSITYGFSVINMGNKNKKFVLLWLVFTFLLGSSFIVMELYEFCHLISRGFGPSRSGFLSSFFTLVGTHGLHVVSGLIWMLILIYQISKGHLNDTNCTRIICLSLFWHFLDLIWICLFTIVYLMGVI